MYLYANHPESLGKCFQLGNAGEAEPTHLSLQCSIIRDWPFGARGCSGSCQCTSFSLYPTTFNKPVVVALCSVLSLVMLLDPPSPCRHAFRLLINMPVKIPGQFLCSYFDGKKWLGGHILLFSVPERGY